MISTSVWEHPGKWALGNCNGWPLNSAKCCAKPAKNQRKIVCPHGNCEIMCGYSIGNEAVPTHDGKPEKPTKSLFQRLCPEAAKGAYTMTPAKFIYTLGKKPPSWNMDGMENVEYCRVTLGMKLENLDEQWNRIPKNVGANFKHLKGRMHGRRKIYISHFDNGDGVILRNIQATFRCGQRKKITACEDVPTQDDDGRVSATIAGRSLCIVRKSCAPPFDIQLFSSQDGAPYLWNSGPCKGTISADDNCKNGCYGCWNPFMRNSPKADRLTKFQQLLSNPKFMNFFIDSCKTGCAWY